MRKLQLRMIFLSWCEDFLRIRIENSYRLGLLVALSGLLFFRALGFGKWGRVVCTLPAIRLFRDRGSLKGKPDVVFRDAGLGRFRLRDIVQFGHLHAPVKAASVREAVHQHGQRP